MSRKKIMVGILIVVFLVLILFACVWFWKESSDKNQTQSNGTGGASIHLSQDHAEVSGSGVTTKGAKVIIKKSGQYEIDGTLSDGQIRVEAGASDNVKLVLNNVSIFCSDNEAIHIKEAGSAVLELKEGTENVVASGDIPEDIVENDDIFSQEDVPDEMVVSTLEPDENATKAAIYSKYNLQITGSGTLNVYGYINNGIQSKEELRVNGGNIRVISRNHGMKGEASFYTENADIIVLAGKDGIHSERQLEINGGTVRVLYSNEGLEANQIVIGDGTVDAAATDDGLNASGESPCLSVTGGTVLVHADGDGLDSNGDIKISGGNIIVDGPTNNGNGGIDSGTENNGVCEISGGTVLVLGSSGMAEGFADSSSQCSFLFNSETHWEAGTKIKIMDEKENSLYEYTTKKIADSIVFSSPELKQGNSYTLLITDSSKNTVKETINQDSVSVSSGKVTRFGGGGMGRAGGGRMDKKRPDEQPGGRPDGQLDKHQGQPGGNFSPR